MSKKHEVYKKTREDASRGNTKHKDILVRCGAGVAVFAVAFFAAFLSSSHFMPISESSAETNGNYYANISSSSAISLDIISTPDGISKVGKDTLIVDTNATSGYKLYLSTISGAAGNGLYLSSDNMKAITATTGTSSLPAKLAANSWGYAPSRTNASQTATEYTDASADPVTGEEVFIGVPEYRDENVIYTNNTPSAVGSNSYDIYYGVNVSTALPSGTYSNTVVYTAIVDAVNPSSEEITISPVSQKGLSAGTAITISTGLYPGFVATNLGDISVKIGGNDCTNVSGSIAAEGNLVVTCNSPAASALGSYDVAVTVEKYGKTYTLANGYTYEQDLPAFFTITKMQEMTRDICQDTNVPTPAASETTALTKAAYESGTRTGIPTITLLDDRAGQISYTVKKLADGQCWMTENLRLPGGASLTPANSDLDGTVVTSYTVQTSKGSSAFSNSPAQDVDQMTDYYVNTTEDPRGYKTGAYYSWRAATAGTGRGSGTSGGAANDVFGTNMNTSGNNTAVSICPKGWRLPTGGAGDGTTAATTPGSTAGLTNGDFQRLWSKYNNYTYFTGTSYGPQLALGGLVLPSGRYNQGSYGYYWSSTVYSYNYAYSLNLSTSAVYPQDYSNKYYGFSVRCIAR